MKASSSFIIISLCITSVNVCIVLWEIVTMIKKIRIIKTVKKDKPTSFCSILQPDRCRILNYLLFLLLFLDSLFHWPSLLERYQLIPVKYQRLVEYPGPLIIYIDMLIIVCILNCMVSTINELIPTIVTDEGIWVQSRKQYNRQDISYQVVTSPYKEDQLIVYHGDHVPILKLYQGKKYEELQKIINQYKRLEDGEKDSS